MATPRVSIDELRRLRKGSLRQHQDLLRACLIVCWKRKVQALPISTTGIPVQRLDGGYRLLPNHAQRGAPDLLIVLPPSGHALMVELKTGHARRSRDQARMAREMAEAGASCIVVREASELDRMLGVALS